jgi:release factor glutamine methyltransferase
MTVQDFLAQATKTLSVAGIPSARLDCLVLLEDALELDRAVILAHPDTELTRPKLDKLNKKVAQREQHVPLAYIRGRAPFYGRDFVLNDHVLVPRPETETMIDLLKSIPLPAHPSIADIGTGTGCIGITAALELPGAKIELCDVDTQALRVAARNVKRFKINTPTHKSDLLKFKPSADVILANLPYVPERYTINRAAGYEPKHAIFGGKDGLNLYRRLWQQIADLKQKPLFVLTESLPPQHSDLAKLAAQAGYQPYKAQDFIQVFKRP